MPDHPDRDPYSLAELAQWEHRAPPPPQITVSREQHQAMLHEWETALDIQQRSLIDLQRAIRLREREADRREHAIHQASLRNVVWTCFVTAAALLLVFAAREFGRGPF